MNEKELEKLIKEVKDKSPKRNFTQSLDLAVNTRQIDLKKPQNKFTEEIVLPKGRGRDVKVAVIGDALVVKAKEVADGLINEAALTKIEQDKKEMKKALETYDYFIAEAPFMIRIGKSLGRFMAPRGKMPKPLPPQADPTPVIRLMKKTVRASLKSTSAIHCTIGSESLSEADLAANFMAVMHALEKKFPAGRNNIKSIYIKTTMGPASKVDY